MKIQIKFSKEEAEGFKNFCKLKPPELEDETFYKQIFFAGCNQMTEQIRSLVEQNQKEQAEQALESERAVDTETPVEGKEILYTGYDIFTHSELESMLQKEAMAELDRAFAVEAAQV